jgi:hypothetical protein
LFSAFVFLACLSLLLLQASSSGDSSSGSDRINRLYQVWTAIAGLIRKQKDAGS